MPLTVQALDHLVVPASDLEATAQWYARVLGMTREDVAACARQAAADRDAIRPSEDQSAADPGPQGRLVHRRP